MLDWVVAPSTTLFLRADNVFDRNYQLAAGYAMGGATIFAGLKWQL